MENENNKFTVGQIIYLIISIFLFPAFILFLAGDWFWIEGWIFSIWFLVMTLSIGIYLQLNDPALLAERQKVHADNQKGWDKYFIWVAYLSSVVWIIIMPLDAKRYGWTTIYFPVWLKVIGGVALLPALFFLFRSVADNTFASTLVRIQTDRKQHVISTGVYGIVRHPMYLGNTFMLVGAPLMMGSSYGLMLGLISIFLMAGRIIGEERMLVNELEGYEEYKKKVRYRLIPFIW
ncbi:MAG TPA: isoprenylcysteine carboxylmethyltransferase family protein [Syntrophomonadaceae bacterium]|nr:isoprenylcysteine carboxylmethyltransferase family protein [Syntrophomonadaceae bacterium]